MPRLTLSFLGTFDVRLDDKPPMTFRSEKIRALLAYLVLESDRSHTRDMLAGLLWPEEPDQVARQNLRQSLYLLRRSLGDDKRKESPFLEVTRRTAQFNMASDYRLDVADFLTHLEKNRLAEMGDLYKGELLAGLYCDSAPLEEWLLVWRERLHRLALDGLYQLTAVFITQNEHAQARRYAEQQLVLMPWREEAHRQMMTILAAQGQRTEALGQYDQCRTVLADELGIEPDEETEQLYQTIRAGGANKAAAPNIVQQAATSEPLQPAAVAGSLVGRQEDVAQVATLLADEAYPWVSLVGSIGVGKTAVANQATTPSLTFSDGIFQQTIPPTAFTDHDVLTPAVAHAVGFLPRGSQPLHSQLVDYLSTLRCLLFLDGIAEDHPLLDDILMDAPNVTLFTSSELPVGTDEEYPIRLTGLPFPATTTDLTANYASIQLFTQQAQQNPNGFVLDAETLPDVARICQFLQGNPLGLIWTAAWLETISCASIIRSLESEYDYLEDPALSDRDRRLWAAFEGSWLNLPPEEQLLLAQLAVFPDDFHLEAAKVIAQATPARLAGLVGKGLVAEAGNGRYQLHRQVQKWLAAKWSDLDDEIGSFVEADVVGLVANLPRRYAAYYLAQLQTKGAKLLGTEGSGMLADLHDELAHVRQAWLTAVSEGDADLIMIALPLLQTLYDRLALHEEAALMLEFAASGVEDETAVLPLIQLAEAHFLNQQARYDEALELLEEIDLATGQLALEKGVALLGLQLLDEAEAQLMRARRENDVVLQTAVLRTLGELAHEKRDYVQAIAHFEEALPLLQPLGDLVGGGQTMLRWGGSYYENGRFAHATQIQQQAIPILRQVGEWRDQIIPQGGSVPLWERLSLAVADKPSPAKPVREGLWGRLGDKLT
ncbi:MAG: BTAD domain-containing putative transcriptional regulator [Chloroflexota bacterium]